MAYQPYYPGYQPNPYYSGPAPDQLAQLRQNQMQQPVMQGPQVVQPQQFPTQIQQIPQPPVTQQTSGMIWINGKAEADSFPIAPGNAVALWDSNNPVVYLRQADSTGKPSTVVYDLVERSETPQKKQTPQVDMSRYITIEDAEEIIDRRVNDILTERLKRPAKAAQKKGDQQDGESV